jgi:NTE family protein
MYINAVFEGGGVKGIGLVGAVCCLEDRGYKIKNYAGTSAGAIVASLLAAGYTGKELESIMMDMDYLKLVYNDSMKKSRILALPYNIINLIKDKGVYSVEPIEAYIEGLLEKKGKTRFRDISYKGKSPLKIIASDITKGDMLVLPDGLEEYGIDPMDFKISKAVSMSISIPIFFKPIKLRYNNSINFIVDGGILSNFPIWIFDVEGKDKWPTFGMKLIEDHKSYTSRSRTDIISYLLDIVSAMINKNEEIYVRDKDWVRTIPIPTLGVGTTQFNISKEKSYGLFQSGYRSAEKFLRTWSFEGYKRQFHQEKI